MHITLVNLSDLCEKVQNKVRFLYEFSKLVRAECVRLPWALLRNEVSTINGVFLSLFSLSLFSLSPDVSFLREGVIIGVQNFAWGFNAHKKIRDPPCPRGGGSIYYFFS
jgi:hypothetical protein